MYYIGVDGGGTKTLLALYTESGEKIYETIKESLHFMKVGFFPMANGLREAVDTIMEKFQIPKEDMVISLGLAGYGREAQVREKMENALKTSFHDLTYVLHNDIEIALEGAFLGEDGIMLVAGTGSIVFMKQEGETERCGGWGYALGDEGSGYWLAKKMLEVFTKQDDGRLEKTLLHGLVMKTLNLDQGHDIISYVMNTLGNERNQVASLSKILYQAAGEGDPYSLSLFESAAKELAELILAVSKERKGPFQVATFGGVFKAGDFVLDPLRKALSKEYTLISPKASPEYGAYLLGKKR